MGNRRDFIRAVIAAAALPQMSWADAGSPGYLSAAKKDDGTYALFGLSTAGEPVFEIPLPARGHAAAAHPVRPLAVAFARRPGTFAILMDCVAGRVEKCLNAPSGHHFYGHGCFSKDGTRLYTTENRYGTGEGMIGVWDAANGFLRIGEFSSGGIGPHDILRLPDPELMVVANGGIRTHPDTGRAKLNLPDMKPNLTYIGAGGEIEEQVELSAGLHLNSIRHLAAHGGTVGFAMQWQGPPASAPPLLGIHRRGNRPTLFEASRKDQVRLRGYAGSIAFSHDGSKVGITCPRGNRAHLFDTHSGSLSAIIEQQDICGLAPHRSGFVATDGMGGYQTVSRGMETRSSRRFSGIAWDNHIVSLNT